MKYYAGIGSRSTPDDILSTILSLSLKLAHEEYTLRSGGAPGADEIFAAGTCNQEIFVSKDATVESIEYVKGCLPNNRSNFDAWKPYTKGLLGRNMMQVLGKDLTTPVEFVVCYAPSLVYEDDSPGGTGYAIRCAIKNSIPVYNMFDEKVLNKIEAYLEQEDQTFAKYMS